MQRTAEQEEIRAAVASTGDNLLIDARAGAGKTTVILDALEVIPALSTLLCAFNKRIQLEMEGRLPPIPRGRAVSVKTLHSVGLKVLRSHFPHLQVPDKDSGIDATEELISNAWIELEHATGGGSFGMPLRRAAVRLLKTLKDVQAAPTLDTKEICAVGFEYELLGDYDDREINTIAQVVGIAYDNSKKFKERKFIDYPDMVWGPVVLGLKPKSRFKAICVDEAQDVSEAQFTLIKMLLAPGGRLILVGDPYQSIYGWRGAIGDVVWKAMIEEFKAKQLGLTITWRCPQKVVKLASQLVRDLKPRPDAPEGEVRTVMFDKAVAELSTRYAGKTFVLSRSNAELLRVALELWKRRVRFTLNGGRDLIMPVLRVVDKLDWSSVDAFKQSAERWFKREQQRAETAESSALAERAENLYGMILVAIEYAGRPSQVPVLLRDVLGSEHRSNIMLSTVHKVKGLEAERVFLLKDTFHRHRKARSCLSCQGHGTRVFESGREVPCNRCGGSGKWTPNIPQEELNIEYVAITRAKETLVWVEFPEDPLTIVLKQRIKEAVDEAAAHVLDQVPDGDEKDLELAKLHYGDDVERMLDGSIYVPERIIGADIDEIELDDSVPIDRGEPF